MPAIGNVLLDYNGGTNDFTFKPSFIDANGVAHWFTGQSVVDSQYHLTQSVRRPSRNGEVSRVAWRITAPTMDSVVPTKRIAETVAEISFIIPKLGDVAIPAYLRYNIADLMLHANAIAAIENLEHVT